MIKNYNQQINIENHHHQFTHYYSRKTFLFIIFNIINLYQNLKLRILIKLF